ncbi:cell envelope biogenesis protein OmpA [Helicobacter monodelphidis]|uniref:OmpA family protein n=1 Tax=Helicobacter sp. 15-1451 TaxID=2004995 RepID=UPI000DCB8076|nr:OmpA family protein [Helicobacter sp. 15-1451]RAX57132.1 cell envelope biogenesis protein OmpA [Helicobacter sp. 15-1451]
MVLVYKKLFSAVSIATCSALFLVACTTNPTTGESQISRTVLGAGIAAAAGAGIGALVSKKNRAKGAAIGAGIGAVAGGAVGGYMDYQDAKLRKQLANTGVSVTRNGDEITLNMPGDITFKTGSADLSPQFYSVLDSVGAVLTEYDKTIVTVAGFTDSTGSAAVNKSLSQKRADTVANYLQSKNVKKERLVSEGLGATNFIADNKTDAGRAQNRRVEISLTAITK